MKFHDVFRKLATKISQIAGSPQIFLLALLTIVIWSTTGPYFNYSNTWQLVINTGTTVITFLMVFLIQNTQNRDTKAIHLKLDELIKSVKGARNSLINIEDEDDTEMNVLKEEFQIRHDHSRSLFEKRGNKLQTPTQK